MFDFLKESRWILIGVAAVTFLAVPPLLFGQSRPESGAPYDRQTLEARLQQMTELLLATQRQMEQSRQQMEALRTELAAMRQQLALSQAADAMPVRSANGIGTPSPAAAIPLQEQVDEQQAEIRQHDQIKVETASKYPLRVTGLVLFNAFANAGTVDTLDLPSLALPRAAGGSHGSSGATVRQTILGLQANGPHVLGATTTADVSTDFFSTSSYTYYSNSVGTLRLRRADIALLWPNDAVHAGIDGPLISPNSPTSFATVGIPALGWSGNLWTWAPQLRYVHTARLAGDRTVQLEGGLWDVPNTELSEVSPLPVASPGELSRKPTVEGRVSYHGGSPASPLVFGVGTASGTENYSGTAVHTWAATGDVQVPLGAHFALTGEIYRGVGLGGFGGGTYKDVVTGTDPVTGAARVLGLRAVGGWTQVKVRLGRSTEINTAYGQDGGFADDLRSLNLATGTHPLESGARNQTVFTNLIFRPKSYIILSPEYRHIRSWEITGSPNSASVFTLSGGYQF